MAHKVVSLALVLVLAFPACGMGRKPLNSVQALQANNETFCTAFSINEQEGLWATAAHCATYAIEMQVEVTIDHMPAWLVKIGYPEADIAVFQADVHAPAYRLAETAPVVGATVIVVGYPWGMARTTTKGIMAARQVPRIHPETHYYLSSDVLDVRAAPGNSGSPVLNAKGEVIGVLWGVTQGWTHALGVEYESTVRFLRPFSASGRI